MSDLDAQEVAQRLHSLLRKHVGRVTDVGWMLSNRGYAQELVRLARQEAAKAPELAEAATALELRLGLVDAPSTAPSPEADSEEAHAKKKAATVATRYIGSLR